MERIKVIAGKVILYFGLDKELWYITNKKDVKTYHFIHLGMHEFIYKGSRADVLTLTILNLSLKVGLISK